MGRRIARGVLVALVMLAVPSAVTTVATTAVTGTSSATSGAHHTVSERAVAASPALRHGRRWSHRSPVVTAVGEVTIVALAMARTPVAGPRAPPANVLTDQCRARAPPTVV